MDKRFDSNAPRHSPLFLATVGLLEVVITCVIVVGLYAAAFGPFGWSSAVQFLTCAILGGLLWYADRGLNVEASPTPERTSARRAPACQ
ncbi:MAG: hypothetical protein ACM3U2_03370 [Deltaproteobacteria bacterium]